jgi:hypothetical protein
MSKVDERIDIRIDSEKKRLLKYVSELKGYKSFSEFVTQCLMAEANKIIAEQPKLELLKKLIENSNKSNVREGWSEAFSSMNQQGDDTLLMPDVWEDDFNELE